jgi:hypothetical protein
VARIVPRCYVGAQASFSRAAYRRIYATKGNGENEDSVAVGFDECDYEAAEFFGFLEVHEVAGVFDYDAA